MTFPIPATGDETGQQLLGRVETRSGVAALRDLQPDDIPVVADYFVRPDAHLDTLIDRSRMGSRDQLVRLFTAMIRNGDPAQNHVAFTVTLDGRLVGFTSLSRYSPEVNYSHWHIIDEGLRGSGLSTALYLPRIETYFGLFPIERLIHQTKASNIGVNRMLDKFVPVAKTEFLAEPEGWATPDEFHIRYVHRHDLPRIREVAARLQERASA